ncbi:MAG: antibiotic biosynthesis monooxygenase family protein [Chloroflexota bacterium]|jgi:heme-degrading monooxygenase HmoA
MAARAMFLIRLEPGQEEEFQRRWEEAFDDLESQPGFRARELIRVADGSGSFVVLSEWDTVDDYMSWRNSITRSHIYGGELQPLFSAPPITGVGELVLRMERKGLTTPL